MNKIDQLRRMWLEAGCVLTVVDAPKDAQTFDKMLVVFVDEASDYQKLAGIPGKPSGKKIIRKVNFYNSREDKIVGDF